MVELDDIRAAAERLAPVVVRTPLIESPVLDELTGGKVLLKADGSGPHTVGSSTGKAFAAASLGRDTLGLAAAIANNPELEGLRDMDPRLVILAGGLPIRIDGQLVGGIGVGGAPSGLIDEDCARAGLEAIGG